MNCCFSSISHSRTARGREHSNTGLRLVPESQSLAWEGTRFLGYDCCRACSTTGTSPRESTGSPQLPPCRSCQLSSERRYHPYLQYPSPFGESPYFCLTAHPEGCTHGPESRIYASVAAGRRLVQPCKSWDTYTRAPCSWATQPADTQHKQTPGLCQQLHRLLANQGRRNRSTKTNSNNQKRHTFTYCLLGFQMRGDTRRAMPPQLSRRHGVSPTV